jgi:ABC-2 type transport system ATP-binding protein
MSDQAILVENVQKSFGRNLVLRGGILRANAGELVCIVGENGSGKSTLLKIIVGLLKPDSGLVSYAGRIGYCPQESLLYEYLTIQEHFRLFGAAFRLEKDFVRQQSEKLMETFSFSNYARYKIQKLSGGTRQKLNLSLTLLNDPELLILDEPYAGFDWETYQSFLRYSQQAIQQGKCILMVSHLVYEKHLFNVIYQLKEGFINAENT